MMTMSPLPSDPVSEGPVAHRRSQREAPPAPSSEPSPRTSRSTSSGRSCGAWPPGRSRQRPWGSWSPACPTPGGGCAWREDRAYGSWRPWSDPSTPPASAPPGGWRWALVAHLPLFIAARAVMAGRIRALSLEEGAEGDEAVPWLPAAAMATGVAIIGALRASSPWFWPGVAGGTTRDPVPGGRPARGHRHPDVGVRLFPDPGLPGCSQRPRCPGHDPDPDRLGAHRRRYRLVGRRACLRGPSGVGTEGLPPPHHAGRGLLRPRRRAYDHHGSRPTGLVGGCPWATAWLASAWA